MPEPITTVGLGAIAAYLGKDGLQKLLGPTADYLGQGLKDFTQRRAENIGHIFQSAQAKLGERIDSPGEVPPKVLKAVLDEGSFSNDTLAVEYFGGILASGAMIGEQESPKFWIVYRHINSEPTTSFTQQFNPCFGNVG